MGLKRVLLFLNLLTSIYLSHANLENSEPKVKNYHYPWIETPYSCLILALVTFLNVSIINYINEKSPLGLTVSSMLYKDIFHFVVVRSWLGFLQVIIQFILAKENLVMMRILVRFLNRSTIMSYLMISTLRLATSISVRWRTWIDSRLESFGIWKIRCLIYGPVAFFNWYVYPSGYLTPAMNEKSVLIGYLPELIGVSAILAMEIANFLLKRKEKVVFSIMLKTEQSNNHAIHPRFMQIESYVTALKKALAAFSISAIAILVWENRNLKVGHMLLFELTMGAFVPGLIILRNRSILQYISRRNKWISTIQEYLRPNRIQPRSNKQI